MPKVAFTISYAIKPETRDQYLALIAEMKKHFASIGKYNYSVYEAKGKRNQFSEMFISNSMEEFDSLEDNLDDTIQQLISKLEGFVVGGMKYSTMIEVS